MRIKLSPFLLIILISFAFISMIIQAEANELEDGFLNPPKIAQPRAYWAWMDGNTHYAQLTRELEEMADKGIAGLDIFDVGAKDPNDVIPEGPAFFGQESVDAIGYAIREAKRLGIDIGVITSSSWNAGGPWIEPKHAAKGLFFSEVIVEGPGEQTLSIPYPTIPQKALKDENGQPLYSKEIAAIAFPYREDSKINSPLLDLSENIDQEGKVTWNFLEGKWRVMRFVCCCTGETLVLPSPNSDGLIIDHFDPDATEFHFEYLIEKLHDEIGSFEDAALKMMYLPSYEVTSYEEEQGIVWTPRFAESFQEKRGYDIKPYLPLLFGYSYEDEEINQRFDFDYRMTLSDLIIEGHYQKARKICNEHGLLLCSEAGGPGPPLHNCPMEALRALGSLDIPRGEFWYKHQRLDERGIDLLWLVKEIACAAHIYGQDIVDGEAFTSWHHWQLAPFDLKPLADRAMAGGLNRFTFHTSHHSPPEAGKPGWAYHAGTHISPNRAWWPKSKPFFDYLARSCYLLQAGRFVGDVLYYYGDEAPNFVDPKHVDPSLGFGYDYDVTNTEIMLNQMDVEDGKIVLNSGMRYEILVLPEREDMNFAVLQKMEELLQKGATIVGPKPTRSNGLHNYQERDRKIQQLANKLWGDCDGTSVTANQYGKGKIVWGRPLREILVEKGITPDFSYTSDDPNGELDFIHRKTETSEIYFVRNTQDNWVKANCTFRVNDRIPELWNSSTGKMKRQALFQQVDRGIKLPMYLPPYGSRFVVFQDPIDTKHITSIPNGTLAFYDENNNIDLIVEKNGTFGINTREPGISTREGLVREVNISNLPSPIEIQGEWDVRFPYGWGAPTREIFPRLMSWTESEKPGIKYFSGIATYNKTFDVPLKSIPDDMIVTLNLGQVHEIADVVLNGKPIGILWKPPFAVDVTEAIIPGRNHLSVEVANEWSNRLVGDAQNDSDHNYTNTNIVYSIMWKQPWKETPLQPSGLLGPVRVQFAKKKTIEIDDQ